MVAYDLHISPAAPAETLCALYDRVRAGAGADVAAELHLGTLSLGRAVRRAIACRADPHAPAWAADRWLRRRFGEPDDALRRAAVAALALVLAPDPALPEAILALYPAMHARLARFLGGRHAYDADLFSKDLALATGGAVPIGPLSLVLPNAGGPNSGGWAGLALRARRAAGSVYRHGRQHGARAALHWLAQARARPWAELHVDVRNLQDFHPEGFLLAYHRLAALMAVRPDLAGVHGASWLYDPRLGKVSPNLAYIRRVPLAGGGRLIRLKIDPVQTAYALARSPARRKLWHSGDYRPACYGLYWNRAALIAWSKGEAPTPRSAAKESVSLRPFDLALG